MTFTHALSTNNYGPSKFIVATSAAEGTHTTLASALSAANSGDTIFLRNSVTENVTAKAGVDIVAYPSEGLTPNISITGTITATFAGTCTISGIRLTTNSAAVISITGTNATIINLSNCYINASNATALSINNANAVVRLTDCTGNIGTTGISLFSITTISEIEFRYSFFTNTGGSSTASSIAAGDLRGWWTRFNNPLSLTGSALCTFREVRIETSSTNSTALTVNTSATTSTMFSGFISSGTATAVVITAGTFDIDNVIVKSTNANTFSGAGTLNYANIICRTSDSGTSNFSTTTQNADTVQIGKWLANQQPAFLAFNNNTAQNNITGNNTPATVNFTNEIYDNSSSYNGTNTFTAPVTGKYHLYCALQMTQVTNGTTGQLSIVTSNRTFRSVEVSYTAIQTAAGNVGLNISIVGDMDAGDTAFIRITINGIGADTADAGATTTGSYFGGFLLG